MITRGRIFQKRIENEGMEVIAMKGIMSGLCLLGLLATWTGAAERPFGLPPLPIPADNPATLEKVRLGEKLFNDTRFSSTGKVSCATCHKRGLAFTDGLSVSEGINQLKGTRNAPTVINAAYLHSQFWDGREPTLEAQSAQPFLNPVEMGLRNHEPILQNVRTDSHIQHLGGSDFVRNWDRGLIRAIQEANLLRPRPDFFIFGGDLAQLGKREEIDHALEFMSKLRGQIHYVMGEHDYYLDLGEYWESQL